MTTTRPGATRTPMPGQPASPASTPMPGQPASLASTPPAQAAGRSAQAPRGRRTARDLLQAAAVGTPGRMRILGALCALAALLLGVVALVTTQRSTGALERAQADTDQVVRLQTAYTDLVAADSAVTSSFLASGPETAAARQAYEHALANATRGISDAAAAQPGDAAALAELATDVDTYAGQVETARANNRDGQPIGAQYLRNASSGLRTQALPILDSAISTNKARAAAELDSSVSWLPLALVGVFTVALVAVTLWWLAQRTHRILNVPLLVTALLMLVSLAAGLISLGVLGGSLGTVRSTAFATTIDLSTARSAAFDAKSNESLTLIFEGSGAPYEQRFAAQAANVTQNLTDASAARPAAVPSDSLTTATSAWQGYLQAHTQVRAKDDAGDWQGAVDLTTATGAGTPSASFASFDAATSTALSAARSSLADGLSRPLTGLRVVGSLALLACLVAAYLAVRGMNARIEEYR